MHFVHNDKANCTYTAFQKYGVELFAITSLTVSQFCHCWRQQ